MEIMILVKNEQIALFIYVNFLIMIVLDVDFPIFVVYN